MEKNTEIAEGNYDFGARIYDSRIGRWLSVDPLSSKYPNLSPYNFTANNPILFVDYNGEDFGIKINHKTKTIVIVSNVYTINEATYREAVNGAAHWNNKKTTVNGYAVSFEINVTRRVEVDRELAIGFYDKELGISTTKNAKKREKLEEQAVRAFSAGQTRHAARQDKIGNLYVGVNTDEAMVFSVEQAAQGKAVGAVTIDGDYIHANYLEKSDGTLVSLGENSRNIGHELGHTMGLKDAGKGGYYSAGGIMEYSTSNSVSDDDVKDVLRYADDRINKRIERTPKVKILENIGEPSEDSPIKQP